MGVANTRSEHKGSSLYCHTAIQKNKIAEILIVHTVFAGLDLFVCTGSQLCILALFCAIFYL